MGQAQLFMQYRTPLGMLPTLRRKLETKISNNSEPVAMVSRVFLNQASWVKREELSSCLFVPSRA